MKIVNKCTGGIDEEEDEKYYGKIITNVAKEVVIDKHHQSIPPLYSGASL